MTAIKRLLLIGYGAIGRAVVQQLDTAGGYEIAIWSRTPEPEARSHRSVQSLEEARAFNPQLALECAGQDAVRTVVPLLLANGVSVLLASVGAMADSVTHDTLRSAALGRARLVVPSGAIGGLDYLDAVVNEPGLEVAYVSTKPVTAWRDELACRGVDADTLRRPYTLFEGTAAEAALRYPQNLNVAATLALHGVGMEKTRVTVRADPGVALNTHEIQVSSAAGFATFRFQNQPSADNPKTSALTALSLASEVARFFRDNAV